MNRHYVRVEQAVANPGAAREWHQYGYRAVCSCGFEGAILLGDAAERVATRIAERHAAPYLAPANDWIAT